MSAGKDSFDAASQNLRLALPLMSKYRVPVSPSNYAVWYQYVAGESRELNTEIDKLIEAEKPVCAETTKKLHQKFVEAAERTRVEEAQEQMRKLIADVTLSLTDAGDEVGRYEESLNKSVEILDEGMSGGALREVVGELIASTHTMAMQQSLLHQALEQSQKESEALRADLVEERRESQRDALTGLANRKGFEQRLKALTEAEDYAEQTHCLMIGDIDKFKSVNDTYGHIFGDKILKLVAKVFANLTKGKDVAARFGGEEFIVLLPQTELSGARIVAETIREHIERGRVFNPKTGVEVSRITISLGVTEIIHGESIEDTINRADGALYQAKDAGRNRVEVAAQSQPLAQAG